MAGGRDRDLQRSTAHHSRIVEITKRALKGVTSVSLLRVAKFIDQLVTEEFYTLGKLVQLGFGTKNYDGNTSLCMDSRPSGAVNATP